MIRTMEEFLKTLDEKTSVTNAGNFKEEESIHHDDFWGIENLEFESGFGLQLERLGILYTFAGVLEINPMGIRVLRKMRADGKDLGAESFRKEIDASKALYHANHLNEESELENSSY